MTGVTRRRRLAALAASSSPETAGASGSEASENRAMCRHSRRPTAKSMHSSAKEATATAAQHEEQSDFSAKGMAALQLNSKRCHDVRKAGMWQDAGARDQDRLCIDEQNSGLAHNCRSDICFGVARKREPGMLLGKVYRGLGHLQAIMTSADSGFAMGLGFCDAGPGAHPGAILAGVLSIFPTGGIDNMFGTSTSGALLAMEFPVGWELLGM